MNEVLLSLGLGDYQIEITPWTLFGLIGNALFTGRMLVQWWASERAGRSVVPVAFWWMSLAATAVLLTYAYGRRDIPFIIGMSVTLVPYIRNLSIYYRPHKPPRPLGPILAAAILLGCVPVLIWREEELNHGWFWVGLLGNAIFMSRFFVAWVYSERRRRATLPLMFWWLSLVGSLILLSYSVAGGDLVFILAFTFNGIPYVRNIMLIRRERRRRASATAEAPLPQPSQPA